MFLVTRVLEAPDESNIFSFSVSSIFQPSQCFVNMALCKMAAKCHEDVRRNLVSMVFAGDSAGHHFQNFIFSDKMYFSSSFLQFRGQKLEQVLFDIVVSPNILICLDVQLRIGQAIDPCLDTTTYEAFAPKSTACQFLSSSNFALSSFFSLACCQRARKEVPA